MRIGSEIVSSSMIREAIAVGDLRLASSMLGSCPKLYGTVERGHRLAGSVLHAPTANLRVDFGVLPPDGVYATRAFVDGKFFPAVTNIGLSPTFGDENGRRVETHIPDFSGDLYHRKMEIELVAEIRAEKRFADPADLETQIRADIFNAMRRLNPEVNE